MWTVIIDICHQDKQFQDFKHLINPHLESLIKVSPQDQYKVKQADNLCPVLITGDMSVKH